MADVVTGPGLELQREGRDRLIPAGALKDGPQSALPEIAARQEGGAAGGAGRCGDDGVEEECTLRDEAVLRQGGTAAGVRELREQAGPGVQEGVLLASGGVREGCVMN